MGALLKLSRAIDWVNDRLGVAASWMVLGACLISAANAMSRYAFDLSSNAWLEIQWYLFAAVFLLCAGYALKHNQHVRIDVIASRCSRRTQAWIEVFGTVFFLLPMALLILALSWPVFMASWTSGEVSANANGLALWPARLLVPAGFALLVLQGIAEAIKRIAFLRGLAPDPGEKGDGEAGGGGGRELAQAILQQRREPR